jgi:hypothetical protein
MEAHVRLARHALVLLLLCTGCADIRERRRMRSTMAELGLAVARRDSAGAARLLHDPRTAGMLIRGDSADPHLIRDLGATLRFHAVDYLDWGAITYGDFWHCRVREKIDIQFVRVGHAWRVGRFQMPDRDLGGVKDACGHDAV